MNGARFTLLIALSCLPLSALAQTSAQVASTPAARAHVQELLLQCDDTNLGGGGGYNPTLCFISHLNAGERAVQSRNWNEVIKQETDAIDLLEAYPKGMQNLIGQQGNITVNGESVPYIYRAIAYEKNKQYDLAISDETEAISIDPLSPIPWNERCWNRAIAGNLPDALQDCQKSLQIAPKSADTLDSTGFVYLKMKNYPAAVTNYEAALKIKRTASSLYGLALAEQAQGAQAAFTQDIAAAQRIDPKITTNFGT